MAIQWKSLVQGKEFVLWEIAETTKGFQISNQTKYNIVENRWEIRAPDTGRGSQRARQEIRSAELGHWWSEDHIQAEKQMCVCVHTHAHMRVFRVASHFISHLKMSYLLLSRPHSSGSFLISLTIVIHFAGFFPTFTPYKLQRAKSREKFKMIMILQLCGGLKRREDQEGHLNLMITSSLETLTELLEFGTLFPLYPHCLLQCLACIC